MKRIIPKKQRLRQAPEQIRWKGSLPTPDPRARFSRAAEAARAAGYTRDPESIDISGQDEDT